MPRSAHLPFAWFAFALILLLTSCGKADGPRAAATNPTTVDKVNFVASSEQEPFHLPTCEWAKKIHRENLQVYETRAQAMAAGHRPCKVCGP